MLVVLAIFAIMSAIVLFNYNSTDDNLLLNQAVDKVTLALRQAQVQSLAVSEEGTDTNNFAVSYGIVVTRGESGVSYVRYSSGDQTEPNPTEFVFEGGVTVADICTSSCGLSDASVRYLRPRPEALITVDGDNANRLEIVLESPLGKQRTVVVDRGGSATVQ